MTYHALGTSVAKAGPVPLDIPAPGEWPCQTKPEPAPGVLVSFLYRLLRDSAPGDVENHAIQAAKSAGHDSVDYCNPHLEANARALATALGARLQSDPGDGVGDRRFLRRFLHHLDQTGALSLDEGEADTAIDVFLEKR